MTGIDGNSPGDMRDLTVNDKIYIGGYFPGSHQFKWVNLLWVLFNLLFKNVFI